jgi:hypothetical protein
VVTFFRIVANPPTEADFTSGEVHGLPPPGDDPETLRVWNGVSAFATLAQAKAKARQYPFLGTHIAELRMPDVGPIRYERTLRRSRGHHTLWGDPEVLLAAVAGVVPV